MSGYFLQSPRLGFRLWQETDLPQARSLWSDAAVTRFISVGGWSEQQIGARLASEIDTQQRHGIQYWPVFLLDTGEHVGCCGLRPHGAEARIPEFGVHIASRHWRRGFAFEAGSCVVEHAFKIIEVEALFAGHNPANAASLCLLTRLGFVYTHHELYAPTGVQHPSYILSRPKMRDDVRRRGGRR